MKRYSGLLVVSLCILTIVTAGCTSQSAPAAPVPVPVLTPPVTSPAISFTTVVTPVHSLTTASAGDPILHRWVRRFVFRVTGQASAYEFRFYPDGTVRYRIGSATVISGNTTISAPVSEANGTWTKLDDNRYQIEILPPGGARIYRVYTLVPAHSDPKYPGLTIPEHIESSFETDDISSGQVYDFDQMYYPERAKFD